MNTENAAPARRRTRRLNKVIHAINWVNAYISSIVLILLLGISSMYIPNYAGVMNAEGMLPEIISFEHEADLEMLEGIKEGWETLPNSIRRKLNADGAVILFVNNDNAQLSKEVYGDDYKEGKSALGCYDPPARRLYKVGDRVDHYEFLEDNTIYIGSNTEDPRKVLIHEVGHLISNIILNDPGTYFALAKTEKFEDLYEEYKDTIGGYDSLSENNVYNEKEMFAESFRIYIEDNEWLRQNAKPVFEYISYSVSIYLNNQYIEPTLVN